MIPFRGTADDDDEDGTDVDDDDDDDGGDDDVVDGDIEGYPQMDGQGTHLITRRPTRAGKCCQNVVNDDAKIIDVFVHQKCHHYRHVIMF